MSTRPDTLLIESALAEYTKDRNFERLIQALSGELENPELLPALLFRAIGTADWELAAAVENHGVALPNEPMLLYDMVNTYGDVRDSVQWLLKRGAPIEGRGPNDWTALHLACRCGYLATVRALVENGADVNARTFGDGGRTPLMEAGTAGKSDVVQYLLEQGADPKAWNSYEGATAAGMAARAGHDDIAALIEAWFSSTSGRHRAVRPRKRNC